MLIVLEVDELETEDREDLEGDEVRPRVDDWATVDDEEDRDGVYWK